MGPGIIRYPVVKCSKDSKGAFPVDDKQIFAALEITGHEVRLIVGEFFNTRFNIIKVEQVPCTGLSLNAVEQPEEVVDAIQKAAADASKLIGAPLQKVILAIPSVNMHRYSVKVTVPIEGIDGEITVENIRQAMRKAQTINIGKGYALIQTDCVKYTVNGISTRRLPIGEKARQLTVEIDMLCADRKLSFDLVGCVEKAGLSVMDIYLDIYAVSKEAALFEQSVDQNVIILKLEREGTTLGLLNKGRVTSAVINPVGLASFAQALVEAYGMGMNEAMEQIKYSARLDEKVYGDMLVHIWPDANGHSRTLSEKQLIECIQPRIQSWVQDVGNLCGPILQAGKTAVIITGEGGELQGLDSLLRRHLNCEVRNYIPETIGGRNSGLTACLGLFYAYKDRLPITGYTDNSLDMEKFIRSVSYREARAEGKPEDTLTNKLKGIIFDSRK